MAGMRKKTVIIGLDGVPYGLLNRLAEEKIMPNFFSLKKKSLFIKMRSSIPPLSSISWSSIITGKNPGQHNIFGFIELMPETYSLRFPNFNNLKAKPFWQKRKDKQFVILNVPSTYPVQPLNGIHLSGFISLDLKKAIYPEKYFSVLEKMNYQVDVDSSLAHQSKSLFLSKLKQSVGMRMKAVKFFWQEINWDVLMIVFTGTDRLGHFFINSLKDREDQYYQSCLDYFSHLDRAIGEIVKKINKKDSLLMLSDHGMGEMKINVNINFFLRKKGFLDLDERLKSYNQITSKTKAFALDPARIYVHLEKKYARGRVSISDKEKVIKKLIGVFKDLKYRERKVIKKIYRQEEVYKGRYLKNSPDLVLLPEKGFRLRGTIEAERLFKKDVFTGEHTLEDAFFLIKSSQIESLPENFTVEDFEPLLQKLM